MSGLVLTRWMTCIGKAYQSISEIAYAWRVVMVAFEYSDPRSEAPGLYILGIR